MRLATMDELLHGSTHRHQHCCLSGAAPNRADHDLGFLTVYPSGAATGLGRFISSSIVRGRWCRAKLTFESRGGGSAELCGEVLLPTIRLPSTSFGRQLRRSAFRRSRSASAFAMPIPAQ